MTVLTLVAACFALLLQGAALGQAPNPASPGPAAATPAAPAATSQGPQPAAPPRVAIEETRAIRATLDRLRIELEQAEAAFRRPSLSADDLQNLRGRIDPAAEALRGAIGEIGPKLDGARARLEQLGPKPKEEAPAEGADVARDRAEREATLAEYDETHRLARAMLLQAEQLTDRVSDRRRADFANALFQRSYPLLSPDLWTETARSFPRDLRALRTVTEDAVRRLENRSTPIALTLLGLAFGVGAALHIMRRQLAPRALARDRDAADPSGRRKVQAALGAVLVETLPAAAGTFLIYKTLVSLEMLPGRLLPSAAVVLGGLAIVAFLQALVEALFAPSRPAWRLVSISDAAASWTLTFVGWFAIVVVGGKVLDGLNQAIAAGLALTIAVKAVAATAAAVTLAELLRRLARTAAADVACLGPYIPTAPEVGGPVRLVGWLLVGLVVAAALAGYVAFASFLVDQIVWIGALGGLLYLGLAASDRLIGGALKENGRVSTALQAHLGLRRRSLEQLGVLASGVAKVVLIVAAAMVALAPWGLESGDVTSNLRAAYFGFKVGDVTISPATIVGALAAFAIVVFATRVVQRWLSGAFLPTTELDAGLRNSITTAVGYVGFFAGAALAFSYLGLSLEKIAIVAGALSVGIGFGLQSIVNNFVSGLILLWERPIRVGDLVVVGDGEGYVRKISVRATEIETFDRSTVIVPNSTLISGTVRNRVRGHRYGRVIVSVNIGRDQDPARAAEIMTEQAAAHPEVLKEPPPRVIFKRIGDAALEFDLICIVADVAKQLAVQSELNFAIFAALSEAGTIPMPIAPPPVSLAGLEPVQGALQGIADAIAAERGGLGRSPPSERRAGGPTLPFGRGSG